MLLKKQVRGGVLLYSLFMAGILDVYKRQREYREKLQEYGHGSFVAKMGAEAVQDLLKQVDLAVSYTHLDVYKRQFLNRFLTHHVVNCEVFTYVTQEINEAD